jgi:hypothetical protein
MVKITGSLILLARNLHRLILINSCDVKLNVAFTGLSRSLHYLLLLLLKVLRVNEEIIVGHTSKKMSKLIKVFELNQLVGFRFIFKKHQNLNQLRAHWLRHRFAISYPKSAQLHL